MVPGLAAKSERQFTGIDAFQKVLNSGIDVVLLTTSPLVVNDCSVKSQQLACAAGLYLKE